MKRYPNLYIVGAPKCGTTALSQWLGAHPEIFVPEKKEPHYFSTKYCLTPDLSEYLGYFEGWTPKEKWAIDASVWYLHSPHAIPNILRVVPNAHFIVLLRNPIKMIPSMHQQQVYNGSELEPNLDSALALNERRIEGQGISVFNGYPPEHLAYFSSCSLGWQIKRLFSWVDADRFHVILHDDLEHSPSLVLCNVYEFLRLAPVMPPAFEKVNAGKVRRFPWLDKIVKYLGVWKSKSKVTLRFGLLSWLRRINKKKNDRQPLSKNQSDEIRRRMADDVLMLGRLLNRDLSHWLDADRRSDTDQ